MSDLTRKACRDCGETKPVTDFWKRAGSPDGRAYYCKPCFKLRNAESTMRRAAREGRERAFPKQREELPDGFRRCADCGELKRLEEFPRSRAESSGHIYYCGPCHMARGVESKTRTHGSTRDYHLKRRYGLSSAEVAAMLAAQMGVCAICLAVPDPIHVDHDHKTGRVRAILCFNCNGGLGQFKDRAELLRRGADYLEGNVWKPTRVAPGVYRLPS